MPGDGGRAPPKEDDGGDTTIAAAAVALETRWVLWFHGTKNNNWSNDSYAILDVAATASDVRRTRGMFERHPRLSAHRSSSMLFWMRERDADATSGDERRRRFVYPTWEDPANRAGGVLCCSGPSDRMASVFWCLVARASGECLFSDARLGLARVNGVSIVPKGDDAVVKVWYTAPPAVAGDAAPAAPTTAAEWADLAVRGEWAPGSEELVRGLDRYFVPHRKVRQKDAAITTHRMRAEYDKERRLQNSERKRGHRGRSERGGRRRPKANRRDGGERGERGRTKAVASDWRRNSCGRSRSHHNRNRPREGGGATRCNDGDGDDSGGWKRVPDRRRRRRD